MCGRGEMPNRSAFLSHLSYVFVCVSPSLSIESALLLVGVRGRGGAEGGGGRAGVSCSAAPAAPPLRLGIARARV